MADSLAPAGKGQRADVRPWWRMVLVVGVLVHLAGFLFWPKPLALPPESPPEPPFLAAIDPELPDMRAWIDLQDATILFMPSKYHLSHALPGPDLLSLSSDPFDLPPPEVALVNAPPTGLWQLSTADAPHDAASDLGLAQPLQGLGRAENVSAAPPASPGVRVTRLDAFGPSFAIAAPVLPPSNEPLSAPWSLFILMTPEGLMGTPVWEIPPESAEAEAAIRAWAEAETTWRQLPPGYFRLRGEGEG